MKKFKIFQSQNKLDHWQECGKPSILDVYATPSKFYPNLLQLACPK